MKNQVKINTEMHKEKKKQDAKKRYVENINDELSRKNEAE
jgi:hypothetical protein